MRGARCKALRALFEQRYGRRPHRMMMVSSKNDMVAYQPSEWRRLKHAYMEARRAVR